MSEQSSKRKIPVVLIVMAAILAALIAVMAWRIATISRGRPTEGPAPDFSLTIFDDIEGMEYAGETITLSQFRGQVVILNFWAAWCEPCRDEAQALQNIWESYADQGVMVIGVDHAADGGPAAREYMLEFGVTYPNGLDMGSRIGDLYHITGVPETFVIDRDGNIVAVFVRPFRESEMLEILRELGVG